MYIIDCTHVFIPVLSGISNRISPLLLTSWEIFFFRLLIILTVLPSILPFGNVLYRCMLDPHSIQYSLEDCITDIHKGIIRITITFFILLLCLT